MSRKEANQKIFLVPLLKNRYDVSRIRKNIIHIRFQLTFSYTVPWFMNICSVYHVLLFCPEAIYLWARRPLSHKQTQTEMHISWYPSICLLFYPSFWLSISPPMCLSVYKDTLASAARRHTQEDIPQDTNQQQFQWNDLRHGILTNMGTFGTLLLQRVFIFTAGTPAWAHSLTDY